MQDCFRKYPDVYGAEIADEEAAEHEAEQLALDTPTPPSDAPVPATSAPKTERNMAATPADTHEKPTTAPAAAPKTEPAHHEAPGDNPSPAAVAALSSSSVGKTEGQDKKSDAAAAVGPISEERGVPEKAFDATGANKA